MTNYISNTAPSIEAFVKAIKQGGAAFRAGKGYSASPYGNLLWSRRSMELHWAWCAGFDAARQGMEAQAARWRAEGDADTTVTP